MTSPARGYFVDGVQLVNTGGERCCACDRAAVGYLNAHPICARHAGMAAEIAEEMAVEKEESAKRQRERVGPVSVVARAKHSLPSLPVHRRNRDARQAQYERQRASAASRTHFKCGHEATPENSYHRRDSKSGNPTRECRTCQLARRRKNNRGRVEAAAYTPRV